MSDKQAKEGICNEYEEVLRNEIDRLRTVNKDLLEALRECMKDSFTAADGMSQSGRMSFAGERYRKAVAAIAKLEGK